MAIEIKQKIVGFDVSKKNADNNSEEPCIENNVVQMHERLDRPEMLTGSTYKVKTPLSEQALYVTINDITLNAGTQHEIIRPFEMFINSKNLEHFQWIVALTRIISAVFRKGGDVNFLVEELHSVFAPSAGYFKKGEFKISLVAEIGDVLERHLKKIGMLKNECLDEQQKILLAEKREKYERALKNTEQRTTQNFPSGAQLCEKCNNQAVIHMDGCMTCMNCGESKCS